MKNGGIRARHFLWTVFVKIMVMGIRIMVMRIRIMAVRIRIIY